MATVGWYNVRDYASPHAALSALLTAGGGVLYFPAGTYAINSTLSVDGGGAGIGGNKPVIIQGDGASVSGHGTNQGTIINWTGTGGVVIDVSNLARMVSVRDLQIDNTGTGAAAIRVNQTDSFSSENVVIYPTTGFSAAAVQIGNSANVVSVTLKNVYLRGNYVALELDSVAAHLVEVKSIGV